MKSKCNSKLIATNEAKIWHKQLQRTGNRKRSRSWLRCSPGSSRSGFPLTSVQQLMRTEKAVSLPSCQRAAVWIAKKKAVSQTDSDTNPQFQQFYSSSPLAKVTWLQLEYHRSPELKNIFQMLVCMLSSAGSHGGTVLQLLLVSKAGWACPCLPVK